MRPGFLVSLFAVLFVAVPAEAQGTKSSHRPAAHRHFRLSYNRSPNAMKCPNEAWFHRAVSAHKGYDPFTADADRLITVQLGRARGVYTSAYIIEPETKAQVHDHTSADCMDLLLTVALSVASFMGDDGGQGGISDPALVPPPPSPISAKPTLSPEPAAVPKRNAHVYVGFDAFFSPVLAASAGLGGGPSLAVRWLEPAVSIELGMKGIAVLVAANERTLPIRSTYVAGVLAACVHVRFVFGCPVLDLGILRNSSTSAPSLETHAPTIVGVGGRLGAEWPLGETLTLRALGDMESVLTESRLLINAQQRWSTPPLSVVLGLGVAVHL